MKKLIIISLVSFTQLLLAGTYYVDYSTGNDANNGTSTSTPWKHLPGDPSATGTPGSISGLTGIIYLKGGVHYNLTTSSGITFDAPYYNTGGSLLVSSGTNVSWGVGMPIIDGAGIGNWIMLSAVTNATFQGLNMGDTVSSPQNSVTAVSLHNCKSNVLDSCTIHDIGTNSSSAHADAVGPDGDSNYAAYHIITNCTIYNSTQKGIEPYRAGSIIIANNVIYNHRDHGIVLTSNGNVVYGNIISNIGVNVWQTTGFSPGFGIKISIGIPPTHTDNNLIYNNVFAHLKNGGIKIDNRQQAGATGDNNKIFNNTFIDIDTTGAYNSVINIDCGDGTVNGTLVMNNIFSSEASSGSAGGILLPVVIYSPSFSYSGGSGLGNNNIVAYNLFWGKNALVHPGMQIGGIDHSPTWANFCDNGSTSPDYRFKVAANGSGNSFSAANQLFDTDPKFVSYPNNLSLQITSPAKGAGTNLSAYFTKDILGQIRTSWSIGAYEFPDDPAIIQQPTDQSVSSGSTATFTVNATGQSLISYQWWTNNVSTAAAGQTSSYTTPTTITADSGMSVYCVVTDTAGAKTSSTVHLTVSSGGIAPLITLQPKSITIATNTSTTFTSAASGTATITYQWQLNGVNITGATTTSYPTNQVLKAASGNSYAFVAANSFGSITSNPAILTVVDHLAGITTLNMTNVTVGTLHLPLP